MSNAITYIFRLDSGTEHRFEVDFDRAPASGNLPDWTLLDTHKCPNCPLPSTPGARCPAAADLVSIVERFSQLASIDSVDVRVLREQFEVSKHTDTQTALSALMGLILGSSGCPILGRMRPLARTHLPFPTETEVVYRIAAMQLLACHLAGKPPTLDGLTDFFADIETLNEAFAKRLKRAITNDAGINALVVLHSRNMVASFSVDETLEQIRTWFAQHPAFAK